MRKMLRPLYVVFSGNICSGKDTIIDMLRNNKKLESLGLQITFLKETVNNDKDVLQAFYDDMKTTTFPFEISTLGSRLVLCNSINNFSDIVIGNRNVIEARHTFVEHAFNKSFLNGMQIGMYDLILRTAINDKILIAPDVVFFLDISNAEALFNRKNQRSDHGEENLTVDYLKELIPYFENLKNNFANIYKQWDLKIPKLILLDASKDISEMSALVEQCEKEIIQAYKEKFPLKSFGKEGSKYS